MALRGTPAPNKACRKRTLVSYKGVRKRTWGRWVSEIRIPNTKKRIWLGSYDEPEKAARAYDAALYCFRGPEGLFNFPADRRPELPHGLECSLSKNDIKAIAASFASQDPLMPSPVTTQVSLDIPVLANLPVPSEMGNANKVGGESFTPAGVTGATTVLPENVEFDNFMMDIEWMED